MLSVFSTSTLLSKAWVLVVSLSFTATALGQDFAPGEVLFGNSDLPNRNDQGPRVESDAGQSNADSQESGTTQPTALTRQLMMQASQSPVALANSVAALSRTGRWSEIDSLLRSVDTTKISADTQAEMAKRIGPAAYLKISRQAEVSAGAKATLSVLAKAQNERLRSPARIAAAIRQLAADDPDKKASAARALFAGGDASIGALADQLVSQEPIATVQDMLPVYVRFGAQAIRPLQNYALYGNAIAREKAIRHLQRFSPSAAHLSALASIYAVDASPQEKTIAAEIIQNNHGSLPTVKQVAAALETDLTRKRDLALLLDRDRQTQTLWMLDPDASGNPSKLRSIRTTRLIAAYRDRADAAARIKRIGIASPKTFQAMLAADLAYQILVDREWGTTDQVDALRQSSMVAWDEDLLSSSVQRSFELGDQAAVLGLLRLIAADEQLNASELLRHDAAIESPLVELASNNPNARIRFEAALAVTRLSNQAPGDGGPIAYAGSSRVKKTLAEMIKMKDFPRAVLVETRGEVIVVLEDILAELGYSVTIVSSVQELLSEVDAGGDLQMILAKTQLWDMPAIELVDRVRRSPHGRQIPIVLYGEDEVRLAEKRWDAATVLMPQPASPAALTEILQTTDRRGRIEPLTPLERREYRSVARQVLFGEPK